MRDVEVHDILGDVFELAYLSQDLHYKKAESESCPAATHRPKQQAEC
jgi:hypothetical protein